jgi:excisionase family DNA binding protein
MKDLQGTREGPVLLDVEEAARRLGTKPRFIRRLIAERRIEFHKLGRHVRISEAALADFIEAGKVAPMDVSEVWGAERMSA